MSRCGALIFKTLIAGALVIMLHVPAAGQKWGEVTDSEKIMGPPANFPEAPAVVIFDIGDAKMDLPHEGRFFSDVTMDRHVRIKIFRKDAAEDAAKVELPFLKKEDFDVLEAQTIASDGTKIPVTDFYTKRTKYVNVRTFTFPGITDGAIVEYHYILKSEGYIMPWIFQGNLFTCRSQFSVAFPQGSVFSGIRRNIIVEPKKTTFKQSGFVFEKYTYDAFDLAPAKDEPLMRARGANVASLSIMIGENDRRWWPGIGRRLNNGIETYTRNRKQIDATASALCASLTRPEDKIRHLYDFVHDSIKEADGNDKIGSASDILKKRRGSDDGRNILLAALLNSQQIETHPLFIGTRDIHGEFNPGIRSRAQLNRIICLVGTDSPGTIIDAADEYSIYPYVPKYDLVGGGLLIDSSNSRAITIRQPERKNGTDIISTIRVDRDGSAICSTTVNVYGYNLEDYHEYYADTACAETIVKKFVESADVPYTIVSATTELDKVADNMKFDIVLKLPTFATIVDSTIFCRPYFFPIEKNYFTSDRRFFPVDYYYNFMKRHRIRVYLPEGMVVSDVPLEIRENIDGASFSRRVLAEGNIIDARADFKIERPCFVVGEYPQLKKLYGIMTASIADKVAAANQANK